MPVLRLFIPILAVTLWSHSAFAKPPNIVLILADDLGYGDVGCYNPASKIPTPNLDRLAEQGVRFTDAHSASTVCTPSRYGLLTGRMCFRTGLKGVLAGADGPLIDANQVTIPRLLKQNGYRTACVGKWHLGMTFLTSSGEPVAKRGGGADKVRQIDFSRPILNGPLAVGFDYFFGTACCPTTDWLYAYIENDRFLEDPTELVRPDTNHWLEYEHFRTGLKAPSFDFRQVDLVFLERSQRFLQTHAKEHLDRPFFLYLATQSAHLPAMLASKFVGKSSAGPLGDFIYEFDYVVGELMASLDALGIADNTLFLVTSDNGPEIVITHMREEFGHDSASPWRGMKRDNWEGGHRVPFIVRWPGTISPDTETHETVCATDLMATFAHILGTELPRGAGEDSRSILPILEGRPAGEPIRDYTLHQTNSLAMAIRKGPWKLLDHPGSGGNSYENDHLRPYALPDAIPDAAGQLYNLDTDPGETKNLIRKEPDIARSLKQQLDDAMHGASN